MQTHGPIASIAQWLHEMGIHIGPDTARAVGEAVDQGAQAAGAAMQQLDMAAALGWASGFRLYAVTFLVGLMSALLAAAGCSAPFSGSLGSVGTPPDSRRRGELLRTVQHGLFSVEVRRYRAGARHLSTEFCDYWISHRGQPVRLDTLYERQNSYNNCQALQLLPGPGLLIMGAERPGEKIPYVVTETAQGAVQVQALDRPWADCALSGTEKLQGWQVQNGQVRVCGQFMAVLPMPAP